MNVTLELQNIEKHITDLISMEFVELRTMTSINVVENMPATCSCNISFCMYCWHAIIFIFELIGLIYIFTYSQTNNKVEIQK